MQSTDEHKQFQGAGEPIDTRALDIVLEAIGDVTGSTATYMLMWRAITRWVESEVGHTVDLAAWIGDKYQIVPREIEVPVRALRSWWVKIYDRKPKLYPTLRDAAVAYVELWRRWNAERQAKRGKRQVMKPLPGQLPLDLQRDATAGDLITDAHRIRCPLDCNKGVSFMGRRGKLHHFACRDCGLEFKVVREPYKPQGGPSS